MSQPKAVLWLVDDSPLALELGRKLLGDDYEVVAFLDGASVIEALAQGPSPEVIVLDVGLPGMSGIELCQFVRQTRDEWQLPILMLTMQGRREDVVAGLKAGANDYVVKPFDSAELRARLETMIRMKALFDRAQAAERAAKEARADAELQRATLRTFFLNAPAAVCLLRGPDHRCLLANEAFLRLVQCEALEGKSLREVLSGEAKERVLSALDTVYQTGEAHTAEAAPLRWVATEAEPTQVRFYKLTYQPCRDKRGNIEGVDAFIFDITEQVLAQRKQEELLSLASHELRTPVTSLRLRTQSLLRSLERSEGPPPLHLVRRGLEAIDRHIARQMSLVDALLDVSRISTGRLKLEPELVDVTSLAREVTSSLAEEQQRSGSKVTVRGREGLCAYVDKLRLDQALNNLLSNALKYGRSKPIEISITEAGLKRLRIKVTDQGIGIAPENFARIFDRFERGVSERNYAGFGLGLWITRQLADAMGGTVSVESRLDEGSTFTLELPRAPEPVKAGRGGRLAAVLPVLVVEYPAGEEEYGS